MIGGRHAAVEGETVRASRNPMAVFLGMALLSISVLGLPALMPPRVSGSLHHQQAGGVAERLLPAGSMTSSAPGAPPSSCPAWLLFGAMLSFDLSLAAIAERTARRSPKSWPKSPSR